MYDIMKLRPFLKASTGIGRGHGKRKSKSSTKTVPPQVTVTIPKAKTTKEASQLAMSLGLVSNADFSGLDVSVANEMLQEIAETKALLGIPDPFNLGFSGSIKGAKTKIIGGKKYNDYYKGAAAFHTQAYIDGRTRHLIAINDREMSPKHLNDFIATMQMQVWKRLSPLGTDSPRGSITHEIGHYLDESFSVFKDTRIQALFTRYHGDFMEKYETSTGRLRYTSKMAKALSEYANYNIHEFVAEAWSEYRTSSSPRPLARQVGDRVVEQVRGILTQLGWIK